MCRHHRIAYVLQVIPGAEEAFKKACQWPVVLLTNGGTALPLMYRLLRALVELEYQLHMPCSMSIRRSWLLGPALSSELLHIFRHSAWKVVAPTGGDPEQERALKLSTLLRHKVRVHYMLAPCVLVKPRHGNHPLGGRLPCTMPCMI